MHEDLEPLDIRRLSKGERIHYSFAVDALEMIEKEFFLATWTRTGLPAEWHEISRDADHRDGRTVKVTIRLDADVVRFFRKIGPGYQPRMNKVLRAFMHLKLAKVLKGPDATDAVMRPEKVVAEARRRHNWGDTADWLLKGEEEG
ncbi:BrnA antitoxin family protein [Roseivivax isoporae]|uniref:3-oxoacyl-ACP synthase n=1 Tax=Roseivivax isoporae LMG 25204 TaxID=1449351 RepID=X7F6X8_9RHOB|nr:BrnA antitoxin family protein [Roseivivax isoporae]ETX28473.1 3-oxoacyl-ACP synthase [Roseivivax isoporae LMG 25204]